MKVIEVKNLSYSYNQKKIFSNVNFEINKGEFVKLTGPNGSGKSTLIKLLIKELNCYSGNIKINGININKYKDWSGIAYLPQNKNEIANFPATVLEIMLTSFYKNRFLKIYSKKDKQKALNALKLVNMENYKNALISKLSGGQYQRVMIARLLAIEPKILILDEPMTGIDVKTINDIYDILKKIIKEKGVTVLMISHDTTKREAIFDRTLCLAYGNLIELNYEQVQKELKSLHIHPYTPDLQEKN